jgi:hypothetical protein
MGLASSYRLPSSVTTAHDLVGSVCVPVVRWLYRHVLAPTVINSFPSIATKNGCQTARQPTPSVIRPRSLLDRLKPNPVFKL